MKLLAKVAVVCFCLSLFSARVVFAQSQFTNTYNVTYEINENGVTAVTKEITVKNNTAEYFAQDFILSIPESNIKDLKATRNKKVLETTLTPKDNQSELTVKFDTQVVGKGKSISFVVTYLAPDVVRSQGKSMDVTIPGVSDKFTDTYNIKVKIPNSKISQSPRFFPQPNSITPGDPYTEYSYTTAQVKNSNIAMSFGDTQNYEMNLIYYIHNPTSQRVRTEVALPPSTEYQSTTYTSLTPQPQNITLDQDGNYLAYYVLEPEQALEVEVSGYATVSSTPIYDFPTLTADQIHTYTQVQEFWERDPQLAERAAELKTAQSIYDYVIQTLQYDKSRANRPQEERLGASKILENPTQAVCTEYTDLFIALARAAGIPAREVNGYALTTDKDVRPLSLSQDTLHSWPEYYDSRLDRWVSIDPTWGDTTGGYDYFNQFDTNHIAFVRKGLTSTYPYPAGAYKQYASDTNVFVQVLKEDIPVNEELQITSSPRDIISNQNSNLSLTLKNRGNTAYLGTIDYSIDRSKVLSEFVHIPPQGQVQQTLRQSLAWYQKQTFSVSVTDAQKTLGQVNITAHPWYLYPMSILGFSYIVLVLLAVAGFFYFARKK